jgi:hypothetical protein
VLVVGNRDCGEVTGDLGRDGELTRGDEGVVGRFKVRGVVPIEISRRQCHKQQDQAAGESKKAPPQHALGRSVAALIINTRDMLIFAFLRQRLNLKSAVSIVLGGRRSRLEHAPIFCLQ